MQKDLDFIAGVFMDCDVPKDRRYLLEYFHTELQEAFLKYAIWNEDRSMFRQHTGHHCSDTMLCKMSKRYEDLLVAHRSAKADLSEKGMNLLFQIETGKYKE